MIALANVNTLNMLPAYNQSMNSHWFVLTVDKR